MNIGVIGLGKLGLPCTLAMERSTSHKFYGYDSSSSVVKAIKMKSVSYWETGVNEFLKNSNIEMVASIEDLVNKCDLIFIAVQTPHEKNYEGKTPTPESKKDFSYENLISVSNELARCLKSNSNANPLVTIVSTVLPGTIRNLIIPILSRARKEYRLAYNPYFIAMGTTIQDFLSPEFVLIGTNSSQDFEVLENFYKFIPAVKIRMSIESAELTKVAYNTFIGFKIVFANTIAEITEEIGGDPDDVTSTLALASKRLMSSEYMRAGLGDGGGCHPRDQIAMSWLTQKLAVSGDVFDFLAKARDKHAKKLATKIIELSHSHNLPICILGVAYKPNSPIDTGSPARLVEFYLSQQIPDLKIYDPWVIPESKLPDRPHIFILGVRHSLFQKIKLPKNSIIFDPWGFYEGDLIPGKIIRFGRDKIINER
jgi:UDPglucose 6-dehydrogenase